MNKHKVKFVREAVPTKIEATQDNKRKVVWVSSNDKN